ncbi:MAG: hypothetical protein K0S09_781 [Sphingobacteriaceae bacterium]|jgi:hypothetical protein|nr:hypothetical protein [Sphingobacteriaceae bacterium]
MKNQFKWSANRTGTMKAGITSFILFLIAFQQGYAQDGNAGITEATGKIRGYFDTGTDLMYAIGAVVGLVGAIKVYQKWNSGDHDTGKVASAWFGSCVFLVIVATVLQSFFGI